MRYGKKLFAETLKHLNKLFAKMTSEKTDTMLQQKKKVGTRAWIEKNCLSRIVLTSIYESLIL